jgi:hypothetical protein
MYLKSAVCFLLLIALASARIPIQGDQIAVSVVGGLTYYGEVETIKDGLLAMNCTGVSEEMPLVYEPRNALGGKDLNYHTPYRMKIPHKDVCIGTGTIIQIISVNNTEKFYDLSS